MTTLDLEAQSATRANPRTLPRASGSSFRWPFARTPPPPVLCAVDGDRQPGPGREHAGRGLGPPRQPVDGVSAPAAAAAVLPDRRAQLDAYSLPALTSVRFSRRRALISLVAAFTTLIFLAFFAKVSDQISRVSIGANFAACSLMLLMVRSSIQPLIARLCGPTAQNVLILDDGGMPVRIPHAWHISTRDHLLVPNRSDPHMLDRLAMFMTNMDRVLVSCPPERRMEWAMTLKGANITGEIIDQTVMSMGVLGPAASTTPGLWSSRPGRWACAVAPPSARWILPSRAAPPCSSRRSC
jgi:hypothetical protein